MTNNSSEIEPLPRRQFKADIIRSMRVQAENMEELYRKSFNESGGWANGRRFYGPMPKPLHMGVFEIHKLRALVDSCLDKIIDDNQIDNSNPEEIAFNLLRDWYYPVWEEYKNN